VASAAGATAVVRTGGRPTAAAAALLEASILDHATAAFLSEGYAATSIEVIARQARVAKRTIYARWNGKPALFLGVLQRLVSGWILSADLWHETDDLEAALRVAARGILRVGLTPEAIALHRLMVAEAGRFPELRTIMAQAGTREGVGRIAALLEAAVAAGKLRPLDSGFAAEQFLHLVLAGPQRRAVGLGPSLNGDQIDAWGEAAVQLFLSGCLPRDRPSSCT
jgi:TetR/AcrR family transcriptional regulator, mexJK operon transcriptional repressor